MPRIVRAPVADSDMAEIWAYIARDNPAAAEQVLARLDRMFRSLASQPLIGRDAAELAPRLRLMPVSAYLIFYRPLPDGIEVARVLHEARDITAEFFRE